MMEGGHRGRKAFQSKQKEGFYLMDGRDGYTETSGTGPEGWGGDMAFQAERKSWSLVGCLDLMRQEVALRSWDEGRLAKS